jgi:hypothetical protein
MNTTFVFVLTQNRSRDASVGIAVGYGLDDDGFESRQGLGIFLFTTASRPALRPTQPPIRWVPGALSLGVKWSGSVEGKEYEGKGKDKGKGKVVPVL